MKKTIKPPTSINRHPSRKRPPAQPKNLVLNILAAMGWIVFLAGLGVILVKTSAHKERMQRVEAEHEAKIAILQADMDAATVEFDTRTEELAQRMEEINESNQELKLEKITVAKQAERLERLEDEAKQQKERLERQLAVASDKASLTLESERDLRARYTRLLQFRRRLVAEYRKRYKDAESLLKKEVESENPNKLRWLYTRYNQSPLGPAFCFAAAETFYKTKKSRFAKPLYEELIKNYPGCEYIATSQRRLSQLDQLEEYQGRNITIHPYKMPVLLTDSL